MVRLTGDPTDWMLPDGASDQELANLRSSLHLDMPLHEQYLESLGEMLRGDAGTSYYYKQDVAQLYKERMNNTIKLAIPAFSLAIILGVSIGTIAAVRHNSAIDRVTMSAAVVGYTLPNFCLGILLMFFLALKLRWLPSYGTGTWKHYIMPMITLAVKESLCFSLISSSIEQCCYGRTSVQH